MKRVTQFLKSSYLIIIGIAIGATVFYVKAASLSIPTNIDNAVEVIKKIVVSSDGVSTSGTNAIITIDSDPTVTAKVKIIGNMEVGETGNKAQGVMASVLGGKYNSISGDRSVIVGGWSNVITGVDNIVGGGNGNNINGSASVIPGGLSNVINASYSFVLGKYGQANYDNTFVWSDGTGGATKPFVATQSNTFIIRASNGVAIGTGNTSGMDLRVRNGTKGKIGAQYYCDQNGGNCHTASEIGSGSGGGGGTSYWTKNGNDIYNNNMPGNVVANNAFYAGDYIATNVNSNPLILGYGIGASSDSALYAYDGAYMISEYYYDDLTGTYGFGYPFYGFGGTATSPYLTIVGSGGYNGAGAGAGYVGIGTTYPIEMLEVNGNMRLDGFAGGAKLSAGAASSLRITTDASSSNYLEIGAQNGAWTHFVSTLPFWFNTGVYLGNGKLSAYFTNNLQLQTNSITRMTITTGGNVGIGTATPAAPLQVGNGMASVSMGAAPMGAIGGAWVYNYMGFNAARDAAGVWTFAGDGASNGGSVLMSNAGGSIFFASIASTGGATKTLTDTNVFNNTKMILTNAGNLGIGIANPAESLDVNGNIKLSSSTPMIYAATGLKIQAGGGGANNGYDLYLDGGYGDTVQGDVILGGINPGNVGIGTTTPNAPLQFANTAVNRKIVLYDNYNNNNQYVGFGVNSNMLRYQTDVSTADHVFFAGVNATTSRELMRIKGDGTVGIGTSAPGEKFEVSGGNILATNGNVNSKSSSPSVGAISPLASAFLAVNNTAYGAIGVGDSLLLGTNGLKFVTSLSNYTSGLPTMTLTSGGYVGIGTATPIQPLDVNGNARVQGDISLSSTVSRTISVEQSALNTPGVGLTISASNGYGAGGANGGALFMNGGNAAGKPAAGPRDGGDVYVFGGNSVNGGLIGDVILAHDGSAARGNVGIGTNSPSQKLEVAGKIKTSLGGFSGKGAVCGLDGTMCLDFNTDWLRVYDTAGSTYKGLAAGYLRSANTIQAGTNITAGGSVTASAFYYTSDRRLKDDIQAITDPLNKILALNGYTFTWRKNGEKSVGVIAQEVEKVFPELVHTDAGGFKSVQYGNLVAPVIEAIKSLYVKYVDQQKKIDDLENRVEKLERMMNK